MTAAKMMSPLLVFNKKSVRLFIYTVTYDRTTGNPALVKRYEKLVKDYSQSEVSYGSDNKTIATGNIVCGNFAEDGTTKTAVVFSWDELASQLSMYHWNNETKVFEEYHPFVVGNDPSYGNVLSV